MGCDIHAAIEYREDGVWKAVTVPNPYFGKYEGEAETQSALNIGRDYDLFAILGNVRNGSGFAGSDTGDGFIPMSDCRGVPDDISEAGRDALSDEHSATWVSLGEILAYDWTRSTKKRGWVNGAEFASWQGSKGYPDGWCGGISGTGIEHVTQQDMQKRFDAAVAGLNGQEYRNACDLFKTKYARTYANVEWVVSYAQAGKQMWLEILPEMLLLSVKHGAENVRLVMDFDS